MKRYKKAFSIENKISSFNIATAKQKTVICDILIGVRENFRNFVISSATKSDWFKTFFSCFCYKNWPYFRLVETLWIPNNSIKILGCPYAFTMYNVTPMERHISVEVNEKHSFWPAETYASLCQLQITLPGLLVSENLPTHDKKWFSDFKQKSSVLLVSVLSVKPFYLYCLFELKYCNYGLGRLKFNTEKNFARVSINYTHVYSFNPTQNGAKNWLFANSSVIICVLSVRAEDLKTILPDIPSEKSMFRKLTGKTVGTTTEPV